MDEWGAQHGEHEPGQTGAAAEIDQRASIGRPEPPELAAVQNVPTPGIGQGRGADQVDLGLPAREQIDIGLQPVECFT